MLVARTLQLFTDPQGAWSRLHESQPSLGTVLFVHTLPFALIPVLAGWYGTTQVGWQIGSAEVVRLSTESATNIATFYYLALLVGVAAVGLVVHWMSTTYGASPRLPDCIALASLSATPLFLVGALQAYPVLWLNLVAGLPALAYTLFLFFTGVPVIMEISQERAFLFSCAVLAFGLVCLVAMLAVTALLWGAGFAPAMVS